MEDDGPGPGVPGRIFRDGHGLSNVRERLRTLYGEEGSLSIRAREKGGTIVMFRLPVSPPWSGEPAGMRESAAP